MQISGDGFYCHFSFSHPDGEHAYAMVIGSSEFDVLLNVIKALIKRVVKQGAVMEMAVGNIYDLFCAPIDQWCTADVAPFLPSEINAEEIPGKMPPSPKLKWQGDN